ncbi:MAG: ABC transporter substrate-binding protein [Phormidesmis sp. RL_2_1]|nr:ABC transporter substrate-binding protein [Phormidesmis sp. RL_2_1]
MSQENNSRFAILATLLAFGLVGGISLLLWALTNRLNPATTVQQSAGTVASSDSLPEEVTSRVSAGEEVLFPDSSEAKQEGTAAIAAANYASAITAFNASLADNPNDPESFIYRSNARIGDDSAYTIAVVAPAGAASKIGLEILRGAAQAQDVINRSGGINGMPVKLVLVNDENDPALAQTIAENLVSDPTIIGVVGHYASDVTLATAPIYAAGKLVTVTPASTAVDLSGLSPYLFRTVPSDSFAAAALAAYMIYYRKDKDVAVYFDASSDLSSSLKEEFKSFVMAWGGNVIGEYDLSQTTFDPNVQREAEAKGVDSLMIAASANTLDAAAAVINFNAGALPILGGDELYNRVILEEAGRDAQSLTVAVPWHLLSRDTDADFVSSSRDLWKGDVSWRTATAYDAVIAIANGLETDASREGLKVALDDRDFSVESATGPINFLPSGDRRQVDRLVKVEPGNRSGTGYDFIPFTIDFKN